MSFVLKIDSTIKFPRGGMLASVCAYLSTVRGPWIHPQHCKTWCAGNVCEANPWEVGAGKAEVWGRLQMQRFLRLASATETKKRRMMRGHDVTHGSLVGRVVRVFGKTGWISDWNTCNGMTVWLCACNFLANYTSVSAEIIKQLRAGLEAAQG